MTVELHFIKHFLETELGLDDISSPIKTEEYALARQAFCMLAKKYTLASMTQMGKVINRDRSTVNYCLGNAYRVNGDTVLSQVVRKFDDAYKHVILTTVIDEETTTLMASLDKAMRENDAMRAELVKHALEQEGLKTFAEYLADLTRGFTERQMYELKVRIEPQIKMISQTRYR